MHSTRFRISFTLTSLLVATFSPVSAAPPSETVDAPYWRKPTRNRVAAPVIEVAIRQSEPVRLVEPPSPSDDRPEPEVEKDADDPSKSASERLRKSEDEAKEKAADKDKADKAKAKADLSALTLPESKSDDRPAPVELEAFRSAALENSPVLREASARIEAVRGKWIQAGLPPNPQVGYSGQQLGSRGQAEQQGMYLGQTIITAKKLRFDQSAVFEEWQRARQEYEQQRYRLLTDVGIAYYEVVAAQRKVAVAEELVKIGDSAIETAEALFKAKEASRIDVLQAKLETDAVRIVLENARQRLNAAWRLLTALIGNPDFPLTQLTGSLDEADDDISWEVAIGRLRTESPELAAAMADVERARWLYQRALRQNVPNLEVQAIPFQRDNALNAYNGAIQVAGAIPLWNRNQGAIREAFIRIAQAEQAVDRIELGLQARLSSVFERYNAAKAQIRRYEQDLLPAAREQLELVTNLFRRGEGNSLQVLLTRRVVAQTSLAYIDALRDRAAAAAEIEGLLLKESLLNGPSSLLP